MLKIMVFFRVIWNIFTSFVSKHIKKICLVLFIITLISGAIYGYNYAKIPELTSDEIKFCTNTADIILNDGLKNLGSFDINLNISGSTENIQNFINNGLLSVDPEQIYFYLTLPEAMVSKKGDSKNMLVIEFFQYKDYSVRIDFSDDTFNITPYIKSGLKALNTLGFMCFSGVCFIFICFLISKLLEFKKYMCRLLNEAFDEAETKKQEKFRKKSILELSCESNSEEYSKHLHRNYEQEEEDIKKTVEYMKELQNELLEEQNSDNNSKNETSNDATKDEI